MDRLKSFTIIEVLGAIFVLSAGVLIAYTVVQNALVYTFTSANRVAAGYLAQEGIEAVRGIRDSNWVQNNTWRTGIGSDGDYQLQLQFSPPGYSFSPCSSPCSYSNLNFVNYSTGSASKFKRKITLTTAGANALRVTVNVMWQEASGMQTATIQSYLYDWK